MNQLGQRASELSDSNLELSARYYEIHLYESYRGNSDIVLYEYIPIGETETGWITHKYINDKPDSFSYSQGEIITEPVAKETKESPDRESGDGYRVYFFNSANGQSHALCVRSSLEDAKLLCLEVHSYLNKCGPFLTTGFTCSYKETGNYQDPIPLRPESEAIMMTLPSDDCSDRDQWIEKPAFCYIVDHNGEVIHLLSIRPLA